MTRVFVCDDSDWFCTLVEAWFEAHEDLELVGCAHERESVLNGLADARPDVVVLDTMTHGMAPIRVDDVRAAVPGVRVLVASGYRADYPRHSWPARTAT
jgi:chemotaxis response regulator CheB